MPRAQALPADVTTPRTESSLLSLPRRVVITGARGYLATALARRLAHDGCALRLVSRTAHHAPAETALGGQIACIAADLRQKEAWSSLIQGADALVHLSARTDLRAAEADPAGDEAFNVEPVRALVRAAQRRRAVPRLAVVFASALTIAGNPRENPVDERAPDNPISVYDRHKLACERVLAAAAQSGLIHACSLRLANVYGPGVASINNNRGVLNAMIRRAASGHSLIAQAALPRHYRVAI